MPLSFQDGVRQVSLSPVFPESALRTASNAFIAQVSSTPTTNQRTGAAHEEWSNVALVEAGNRCIGRGTVTHAGLPSAHRMTWMENMGQQHCKLSAGHSGQNAIIAMLVAIALSGAGGCTGQEPAQAPARDIEAAATTSQAMPKPESETLTRTEREAALNNIRLKRVAAAEQERAQREAFAREQQQQSQAGTKCIGGTLYGKEGNEWRELGPC